MHTIIGLVLLFLLPNSHSSEIKNFGLPVYKSDKKFQLKKALQKHEKVLINFWASWCTGCIQELPKLEELKKKYKKVLFVAINAGESGKKIEKFIKTYNFSYLILEDKDRAISKSLDIKSLPQTLLVDKNRKILFRGNRPPKKI